MKTFLFVPSFLLILASARAQETDSTTTTTTATLTVQKQDNPLLLETSTPTQDTSTQAKPPHNKYGDLLNDDPVYNRKSPWIVPAARVVASDVFIWSMDKYLFRYPWPSDGIADWKNNFKRGPEWDADGFGVNFFGHPYSGNFYFNAARSNGYSYWGSFPFAVEGSFLWEFLGEKTKPSYNDFINTPISDAFWEKRFTVLAPIFWTTVPPVPNVYGAKSLPVFSILRGHLTV